MKKTLLLTAALLMGTTGYSYAQAENFKPMTFAQMDKNGDSVLTKEEVRGRLLADFEQLDSDKSGTLSASELPMFRKGRAGKHHNHHQRLSFAELDSDGNGMLSESEFSVLEKGRPGKNFKRHGFARMDKNGDGVIAKDEVGGRLLADFEQLDVDKSGTLSANELPMGRKGPAGKSAQPMGRKGPAANSNQQMGRKGPAGKNFERPTFAQMDKNGDGFLAKDEVGGRLLANFEQLDVDNSGTLSANELPRANNQPLQQGLKQK